MFKAGDRVKYVRDPVVKDITGEVELGYAPELNKGEIYTVLNQHTESDILLKGFRYSFNSERFELVEETPVVPNNPAIEEYTKTIIVRNLKSRTDLLATKEGESLVIAKVRRGVVSLSTRSYTRNCYSVRVNAEELRTLAKQLTEIADVMDENKE